MKLKAYTQKEFNELKKRTKEVDTSDKSKFTPFYKLQLEWLEEELKEAIEEENFEWAENVKKEIEQIKRDNI